MNLKNKFILNNTILLCNHFFEMITSYFIYSLTKFHFRFHKTQKYIVKCTFKMEDTFGNKLCKLLL